MKKAYLILLFILISGCLPESKVRGPISDLDQSSSTDSNNSNNNGNVTEEESDLFGSDMLWFNSGLSSEVLTVNVDNTKTIYLIGDQVHNYLLSSANYNATYCLEARFEATSTTSPKILRVKVVPAFSNNFHIGQTTRFFRVNLATDSGNSYCNIASKEIVNGQVTTIQAGDTNYDGVVNGQDNSYVYQTEDVCSNCLNILASNQVILYKNNENSTSNYHSDDYLERVEVETLHYDDLTLRIDMNANSSGGSSSCSDSACQANGFDCCVDGQCVNEKSIKAAGVAADPQGYAVAQQEQYVNENWYKNYPQFYYICLEQVPNGGGSGNGTGGNDPSDPVGDAQAMLEALIKDYQCMQDIQNSSQENPFHKSAINNTNACSYNSDTYENVFKRLYTNCGCYEDNDLSVMVNTCPAYTYTPVYQTDSNGDPTSTILSISCVTPPVDQTPGPFQDLDVVVNSRVAPHRFFDQQGYEITPGEDLPTGATGVQEGIKFEYLDNYYIFPKEVSFNMNSILGSFNVNLSGARPAVTVDVEFDKQYIISTLNGLYPGCPTCAKDSWFNNFSAAPMANYGVGLQAVYFTTRRDSYGSNTTLGNYEDTIFGRACYLPPTMIPFSHSENPDVKLQRQARLKTQAALFANGYQRDWFGFNRGALIGSFDGVTWFAIGKGRIVKSTSNKLFLAINAPFADLTTPTNHTVAVQEYDFYSTAPRYDYVPGLEINDAYQNEAGSCQQYHECETDSHCITKLGWEYVCADVTYTKTKWPQFSALGAEETANTSYTGTIEQFLQQGELPPNSTTKRCVYRGAGAPCRVDYSNIADEGKRKTLTCAPNFYCADLDDNNAFNDQVARFGRPLDELVVTPNHFYGQDANILGRPRHYISNGNLESLDQDIKQTIEANVVLTDAGAAGKVGLCRPGKKLPDYANATLTNNWEQTEQHESADYLYRTDYISQIGSCNSALYTDLRYSSCPMLDEDGNYIHTQDDFIDNNYYIEGLYGPYTQQEITERYTFAQNACGLESLSSNATYGPGITADMLKDFSAFKTIEGRTLATTNTLTEQTLARDACLRKAGAVCHTDLDCSPNRLMASVVDLVDPSYFGNAAEKLYYEEYLVCGQAESQPLTTNDYNYNTYNMHNNKCCRPVGQELTMFTEDSPNELDSQGLRTDLFGSMNPTEPTRYSRYSAEDGVQVNSTTKEANITRPTANTDDVNSDHVLDNPINITNSNQWETIHNNAAKICCGGSWVRKFADGTNDWTKKRLNLDVNDFKCLNYNSPLPLTDNPAAFNLTQSFIDSGLNNYCADPTLASGGCVEQNHQPLDSFDIDKPTINATFATQIFYTNPAEWGTTSTTWENNPWTYHPLIPIDGTTSDLIMNWTVGGAVNANRNVLRTFLPSWVAYNLYGLENFEDKVKISMKFPATTIGATPASQYSECIRKTPPLGYTCNNGVGNLGLCSDLEMDGAVWPWSTNACGTAGVSECCYTFNPDTRQLTIAFDNETTQNPNSYGDPANLLGAKIEFEAPGTLAWEVHNIESMDSFSNVADETYIDYRRSSSPGNSLYYLERLSRFEYVGIPQMRYEPVYCNNNYQKLVPGLFHTYAFGQKLETVMDFLAHGKTFIDNAADQPWAADDGTIDANFRADNLNLKYATTQELVDHAPIFSDNKFKCCLELGSQTTSKEMCCSGYAVDANGNTTSTNGVPLFCKLPEGTNLNVYFNKFVSGEGISDKYSETVLDIGDFDANTGEPKMSTSIYQKLVALGEEFCASASTRRGGAYGNYDARPLGPLQVANGVNGSTNYTIVDSIFDEGSINNLPTGYSWFSGGFRWNHHVYCGPPTGN